MPIALTGTPVCVDYGALGFSKNYTVPAGTDCLIVFIGDASNVERNITAVTAHGRAMTQIPLFTRYDGVWDKVTAWYLLAPDVGSFDINAAYDASPTQVAVAIATFSGVHQTVPLGTAVVASAVAAADVNPSATVTASAGDWALGFVMSDADTSITEDGGGLTTGGTLLAELATAIAGDNNAGAQYKTSAGSITLGWSAVARATNWAAGAVPLKPADGGGGGGADLSVGVGAIGEPTVGGSTF